jgi:DNA-binding CsgD family transcriptional regulator
MANTTTEAAIRALVAQGKKFPEIARELDVNYSRLLTACSLLGIKSPMRRPVKADAFLEGIKAGKSLREIGAEHGVSHAYVHTALRRAGLPTTASAVLRAMSNAS